MGEGFSSIEEGVSRVKCPILVIGTQTDMLIPCWQQKEMADLLRKTGTVSFHAGVLFMFVINMCFVCSCAKQGLHYKESKSDH